MKQIFITFVFMLCIFFSLNDCTKSDECRSKTVNLLGILSLSKVAFSNFPFSEIDYVYHSDAEKIDFYENTRLAGCNFLNYVNVIKTTKYEQIWEGIDHDVKLIDSMLFKNTSFQTFRLKKETIIWS